MSAPAPLWRAAGLGLATGGRSTAGLTALSQTTPPGAGSGRQPLVVLTSTRAKRLSAVLLLGELVGDKLPQTPSRRVPPVLGGRMVAGAVAGAAWAQRERRAVGVPAALAAGSAVVGSVLGVRWRALAAQRGWPDLPAALLEDAVVAVVALVSAWAGPVQGSPPG